MYQAIPSGAHQCIITQQAINILAIKEKCTMNALEMPTKLMKFAVSAMPTMFEHFANPMVHPVTGENISSYKI
jgi:hypothetical protein